MMSYETQDSLMTKRGIEYALTLDSRDEVRRAISASLLSPASNPIIFLNLKGAFTIGLKIFQSYNAEKGG